MMVRLPTHIYVYIYIYARHSASMSYGNLPAAGGFLSQRTDNAELWCYYSGVLESNKEYLIYVGLLFK